VPTPFDFLTKQEAVRQLDAQTGPLAKTNALYLNNDHWQNGDAWIGPKPLAGEEGGTEMMARIQTGFVFRNAMAEVTERHQTGVVGWMPAWGLVTRRELSEDEGEEATPEEQAAIDEATAAVRQWWTRRKVREKLQRFVRYLLSHDAGEDDARAVLRLRITAAALRQIAQAGLARTSSGALAELPAGATVVQAPASLAAALEMFVLEAPNPLNATVVTDADTLADCGIIRYQQLPPGQPATGATPQQQGTEVVETYYLADPAETTPEGRPAPEPAPGNGRPASQEPRGAEEAEGAANPTPDAPPTVYRRFTDAQPASGGRQPGGRTRTRQSGAAGGAGATAAGSDQQVQLQLGGRLPVFEARRSLFLTGAVQAAQKAINLCCTMQPFNVTKSGFLATTLLNAQMPGEWEYKDGKPYRFKPGRYRAGAGTVNFVRGLTYKDQSGNTVLATPGVHETPPSETRPTREAKRDHYQDLLEETDQSYILMSGDAVASGVSRVTARADFVSSLQLTQEPVEQAGRWLIETALALAEVVLGTPGRWTNVLRADFACRLNVGPADLSEQQANDAEVKARRMSRATAMSRNGIQDVEAEQERIDSEPGNRVEFGGVIFTALRQGTDAGLTLDEAGEFLGLDATDLDLLKRVESRIAQAVSAPPPGGGGPGADLSDEDQRNGGPPARGGADDEEDRDEEETDDQPEPREPPERIGRFRRR
jgi:hypothetical protein